MTAIVIIVIIIILIAFSSVGKKSTKKHRLSKPLAQNQKKESPRRMNTTDVNIEEDDSSIIDVTGHSYQINPGADRPALIKYPVPYWRHQYVYNYAEINYASPEQVEFYRFFKTSFLKGAYIDLEGNSNYAFILLFDLLRNDYEKHRDLNLLEKQFEELGYYYPKTRSYAISFLIEKMEATGDRDGIIRLRNNQRNSYYQSFNNNYAFEGAYWGLGTRYKSKLNLDDSDITLLNKLYHPGNNFCSIEYCCLEVLKLFLLIVKGLNEKLLNEGTTIDQYFNSLAGFIVKKQYAYQEGSVNYKYAIDPAITELYTATLKYCENAVRGLYGHKRKINPETHYTNYEAKNEIETKLFSLLPGIIQQYISKINPPDEATEIELYSQNTGRWKIKFELLTEGNMDDSKKFIADIVSLGDLNKKNPSIENIFFEASKFIAKKDKEASLTLYVHYLFHDLKSASFDNKQLTKTIQKSLFKTNEQLHDFEVIVSDLIKDKNMEEALRRVPEIYKIKRKKIRLDKESIKEVKQEHSGTVELLNEYLKDEYEGETNSIKAKEINSDEIQIQITPKTVVPQNSVYISGIVFTSVQQETLEFFSKSNFSLPEADFESFTRAKGVFKNQLVESINACCFDCLEDLLIEEEDEFYIINPNYYQRLLAQ